MRAYDDAQIGTCGRLLTWTQEISPFSHILTAKSAEVHCTAMDLAIFRKHHSKVNGADGMAFGRRRRQHESIDRDKGLERAAI